MRVGVIGCGYVGLVTAVGMASKGHRVVAVDIDKSRVVKITKGKVPFHEPGVEKRLRSCLEKGTLKVSHLMDSVTDCEVVLICVQTPPKPDGVINLKILEEASNNLKSVFEKTPKERVVIVRSTVIPGTTDNLITPIFRDKVAVNPEFLREGSAMEDFLKPDRIVIGTESKKVKEVLTRLYKPFKAPIIWVSPSTAELAKYTSNTLLATLISFSNEIARLCEKTSKADIEEVLGIVHLDRRFYQNGSLNSEKPGILTYLKAGCGFGGSCLPKDLSALIAYASSLSQDTPLLKGVAAVNTEQPFRVVKMAERIVGSLAGRKIVVLGVAFKGGTDDLRESPGLRIVEKLLLEKAQVIVYDPLVSVRTLKDYQERGVKIATSLNSAINLAEIVIIASNASEFRSIEKIKGELNKNLLILDGRRILKNIKKDYFAVGRAI